jgi:hypothetical protein
MAGAAILASGALASGCGSSGSKASSSITAPAPAGTTSAAGRARPPGKSPSGEITDQQGHALLFQLGKPKAKIVAELGAPAAVGGPSGPGSGSSCLYYRVVGRAPSNQWRVCFAAGKLASASTTG